MTPVPGEVHSPFVALRHFGGYRACGHLDGQDPQTLAEMDFPEKVLLVGLDNVVTSAVGRTIAKSLKADVQHFITPEKLQPMEGEAFMINAGLCVQNNSLGSALNLFREADAVIVIPPVLQSGLVYYGWCIAQGKQVAVWVPKKLYPVIEYSMASFVSLNIGDILMWLGISSATLNEGA